MIQVSAYKGGIAQLHTSVRKSAKSNGYYYGTTADPILINAALGVVNGPTQCGPARIRWRWYIDGRI